MLAEPNSIPSGLIDTAFMGRSRRTRGVTWFTRVTTIPHLTAGFLAVTLLAIGPLQGVDDVLNRRWLRLYASEDFAWFAQNVLDRIAGQAVCFPILALTALILALKRRSWEPLVFAMLAEVAFFVGVGGLKVLLGRPSPTLNNPAFFEGGLLRYGDRGISFPSGHAAEAVLIYGAAVFLIASYGVTSQRLIRILIWAVVAITINSIAVSFLLGWHWLSDLIGGVFVGGLFLRLLILGHERTRHSVATEISKRFPNLISAAPYPARPSTIVGGAASSATRRTSPRSTSD